MSSLGLSGDVLIKPRHKNPMFDVKVWGVTCARKHQACAMLDRSGGGWLAQ